MRKLLIIFILALTTVVPAVAVNAPEWEEVTAPAVATAQTIDRDSELDIVVRDGYIYLWCEKTVTVKLFSILGQQISSRTLKPGMHRIKLSSRGIYILRAGTLTRRITL